MHDYPHRRLTRAHSLRWLLPLLILVLAPLSAAGQGAIVWQVQVGTPDFDGAGDVAVDSAGNVYLVGITAGNFAGQTRTGWLDGFVSKYTPDGALLWTRLIGVAGASTHASSVAVDADDNVYVVGSINASLDGQPYVGQDDAYVRKYDSGGMLQWTRLIGTAALEIGDDVAVDGTGRVYVVGSTWGSLPGQTSAGNYDIFLSVYDGSGTHQWTRQTGSSGFDLATSVAVDGTRSAYLAGFVEGPIGGQSITGGRDAVLIKYDASGVQQWTRLSGYPGYDAGRGVAVDAAGTSYLAGEISTAEPAQPGIDVSGVFVRSYDAGGTLQWSDQFGSVELDAAADVALDAAGDLYVAGYTFDRLGSPSPVNGLSDMFVRKYTPGGRSRWTLTLGTAGSDTAWGVAVHPTGALYLAGATYNGTQGDAVLFRSINPTLTPRTFLPLIPQ